MVHPSVIFYHFLCFDLSSFDRLKHLKKKTLNTYRVLKNTIRGTMEMDHQRTWLKLKCTESEASEPSELNDMLPKQNHTFVILFPRSALWLMFCQLHTLGSLHSNCQGHKAGGSGECRMTDVTEGWIKKETVYVWYVLGGFQLDEKKKTSGHAFRACILVLTASDVKVVTFFWTACLNIMLCMKFWRKRGYGNGLCVSEWKKMFLSSQSQCTLIFHNTAISSCTVL